ncbi:hypothetical protein L1887_48231 [Cichorium endivia]|nr:hypothetical protein L1887_48231 [Cichorium endivia]
MRCRGAAWDPRRRRVRDEVELVEHKEDRAARFGERHVLGGDLVDLVHDGVGLLDLGGDLGGFLLERLEGVDDLVVVEDVAFGFVERGEERALEVAEAQAELALELHQVGSLAVGVWAFDLEHLVERLALEAAARHGEVDKGDAAADVGRKLDGGVACGEEHVEGGRKVDVLAAEADEHTAARSAEFLVEDRIEDGIEESLVEEAGGGELLLLVLVEEELDGLARGVDDERIAVPALEHDGVLGAEGVGGERPCLPLETLVCGGEVVGKGEFGLELDLCVAEVVGPVGPHGLAILLVEEAGVGEHGCGQEGVADDGAHLVVKGAAAFLPSVLFGREAVEELHGARDAILDALHLDLMACDCHGTDFGEVLLLDVADGGLGVLYGGFCVGEVSHDDVSALADLGLLVREGGLDLYGCGALLLGLLLALLELFDLVYGGAELVEADEEEALLVLELVALLVGDLYVVLDEAEEVTRRLVEAATLATAEALCKRIYGEVDEDERLDDELAVGSEVEGVCEFGGDGATSVWRPVAWRLPCAIDVDDVHVGRGSVCVRALRWARIWRSKGRTRCQSVGLLASARGHAATQLLSRPPSGQSVAPEAGF